MGRMPLPVFGKAHEASPGAGFVWFVYGSSLDRDAFAAWATEHGYALPDFAAAQPARLPDHRLAFDVLSRYWGGPVASLAEAPGAFVEGLAVPMPGGSRGLADHREGVISGLYEPYPVQLVPVGGGTPLPALAFRAAPERRLPEEAPPSPRYLATLLRCARPAGLSAEWIAALERLAAPASGAGE
jgi:gamma-glutamylcyclotransferase